MKSKTSLALILMPLVLGVFVCSEAVSAIKFLPASGNDTGGFRAVIDDSCMDYPLLAPNCQGKKCEQGWICDSCTNSVGTYYKCEPAITPVNYTAGVTSCEPCNEYLHNGFTGDLINGRCVVIDGCMENALNGSYEPFQYVIGVEVSDTGITYIEKTGYKKNK